MQQLWQSLFQMKVQQNDMIIGVNIHRYNSISNTYARVSDVVRDLH